MPVYVSAAFIGYLLGSIPFGLIFTWMSGAGDVRKIGSGSIGATNVLRTGKYGTAAATLVFDAAKGAAAVLIAQHYFGDFAAMAAALGAMLGHLFPLWLGFKGGKGIAVSLGILLSLYWPVGLIAFATWGVVVAFFRISSLAAIITAIATPIYMWASGHTDYAVTTVVLALLTFFAHRDNIRRLIAGTEPRIGQSKS
jgi:acyl phosphate:glycerol-3-phosphate acyltransferase